MNGQNQRLENTAKYKTGFIPIVLAVIIAGGVLTVGGGTYTGVTYYQSSKLIKEADKLADEGNYADALAKYDKAKHKWRWSKIETKKSVAVELKQLQDYSTEGNRYVGEGEWQKCLEYLGKVTSKFPSYNVVRAQYADCEKKLAEKQSAEAAAAEAKKKADEKPAPAATEKKATSSSSSEPDSSTSSDSTPSTSPDPAPDSTSSSTPSSTNQSETESPPALYLPFSASQLPDSITPMGETIYHPKPQNPQGHPGIDYQWNNPSQTIRILASMDGEVTGIKDNTSHAGTYDLSTKNGRYRTTYTEMEAVNSSLKVGDQVKVGDFIGNPQHPATITDQPNFRMIHWEFGYHSEQDPFWGDRLCPLTYFTASAKSTIETIWANVSWSELKANAPDICSGDYKE